MQYLDRRKIDNGNQGNIMGKYHLWLQHREVDQHLRRQHLTCQQELSEIDEQIARLQKKTRQLNNALITALVEQLNKQEQPTTVKVDTIEAQPEHNEVTRESAHDQTYQTIPLLDSRPQNSTLSPPLLWNYLPNYDTQDISIAEEEIISADVIPVLPEEADDLLPSDFSTLFDREPPENVQPSLPWWLRNIEQTLNGDPQPPLTAFIDQQRMHANQRVERWFARRIRLVHYDEGQGHKK